VTEPTSSVPLETLLAHRAWVRSVARALVADPNDADDVEQETWLAALAHPPRHAASLRGWLGAATRNVARKLGRGETRRGRHELAAPTRPDAAPAADLVAEAELQQRIGRAVLELDEPFRSTVLLRHFDGLPPREVAARLGVPVETVRSRLRRAHERLRERLDEEGGGDRRKWALAALAWRDGPTGATTAATTSVLGGLAMTTVQKLAVAAVVLLAIGATTWIALRDPTDAKPVATASSAVAVPAAPAPTQKKTTAARAHDATAQDSEAGLPPVDLDKCDRDLDLFGIVVDPDGKGVAGASVATITYPWRVAGAGLNVRDGDMEVAGPATRSARDGTFALRLTRGAAVNLRVAAESFATVEIPNVLAGERVRVTLGPGVRLVVTLLDAAGLPVDAATVRLFNNDRTGDPLVNRRGTTDASGLCTFDGLTPKTWAWIAPESPKGGVGWTHVEFPVAGELTKEIRLAAGRTITGRVIDSATKIPIDGARVGVSWTLDRAVTTRADGSFDLPGWSSSSRPDVAVAADGYAREERAVGSATRLDFELVRGYSLIGRAVDPNGHPVAGARVGVIATKFVNQSAQTSMGFATSHADGRFSVTSLTPGMPPVLIVTADGFARSRRNVPDAASGAAIDIGDVVLAAACRVEGVLLGADKTPQPRVPVTIEGPLPETGPPLDGSYGLDRTIFTDDLGRFRFPDVAPGSYTVTARPAGAPEISTKIVVAADADVLAVKLVRDATREIVITLIDSKGEPIEAATLNVSGAPGGTAQGRTNVQGVGRVQIQPGGHLKLTVMLTQEDWKKYVQPKQRDIADGEDAFTFELQIASAVTGRLVDPDGAPVARAQIEVNGDGVAMPQAWTDDDGRFRVLVPGKGRLTFTFAGCTGGVGQTRTDSGLTARVDEIARDTDVVVRCERTPRDARLAVFVVSPDEKPVAGAIVYLFTDAGSVASAKTDAAGRAAFEKLPARELAVSIDAHAAGFLPPERTRATPDGQDVRLVAVAAAKIAGTVTCEDGSKLQCGIYAYRDGKIAGWGLVEMDGKFTVLLPADDATPVCLQIDLNGDGKAEAFADGVAPGTSDVRLKIAR
jgi:RNA polymerase sigma-70 factor (ECF subfamily)